MNRIDLIRNAVNNLNSKSEFKTKLTSKNKLPRTSKAYNNFLKSEMTITNNLAKLDINHNVLGNENLLAEESNNIMLQMGYKRGIKRGVYNFDVSGFYNGIKNQISLALIDASTQLYTYTILVSFIVMELIFTEWKLQKF